MELNWTTFVLEIANFLVLVWLLKHFLYQPVKAVIAKRQREIEEQLQQADALERQAVELRSKYERRLADWERERELARVELQSEIDQERQNQMTALQQEIQAEHKKAALLAERRQHEQQHQLEARALEQGARFVAKLLKAVASPEVQDQLFDHFLSHLKALPLTDRRTLKETTDFKSVQVTSAYPLHEDQRARLKEQLSTQMPGPLEFAFHEDRKLIAGLRVTLGHWVLHANLQDELTTFASIAYEH